MSEDVVFYRYEEPPAPPAGVTVGHLVLWHGEPGPAWSAECAMLVDTDGTQTFHQTSDFKPITVTDD